MRAEPRVSDPILATSVDATATRPLRICVVSEGMTDSPDEGIKKFATTVVHAMSKHADILGVSLGEDCYSEHIVTQPSNRLLLSRGLWKQIRSFGPDMICYIPTASNTVFSFLRLKVLASVVPNAATMLIALQPRPHGIIGRWFNRRFTPDLVLVQSKARVKDSLASGLKTRWIPSGVDLERFRPVDEHTKRSLRAKHGLPLDAFLVLHVGHVTVGRNIAMLSEIQRDHQVVMVTGNSVGQDLELRQELEDGGVIVFDSYLEAVEEIYQASDCYLFPVMSEQGSIEIPLSVIEAMACNLPVVSTRFGGLEDQIGSSDSFAEMGLFLADSAEELPPLIEMASAANSVKTEELVQAYSWEGIAALLIEESNSVVESRRTAHVGENAI